MLVQIQNGTATMEDSWLVSYKETLTTQFSNCVLLYFTKEVENFCLPKPCTQMFTVILFIICQNLEATGMPFSR